MAALTCDRMTDKRPTSLYRDPLAAGARIFAGAMVVLDAQGFLKPAGATGTARGMSQKEVDNRLGQAGDVFADVEAGCFGLKSDGSINRTHIGKDAQFVDDQTVSATGSGKLAGLIKDVEGDGLDAIVWVQVR
jgi:hypothetical protein